MTENVSREPVKKREIKADWIQKEKLTVLETKEDKRSKEERGKVQSSRRDLKNQIARNDDNAEILGFGAKPQRREREEEPRENRDQKGGKGKDNRKGGRAQNKVNLKEDDFPTL